MGLRPNIFDSAAERKVFAALQTQWRRQFSLYPQLPIAKLFSTPPSDATAVEKSFFYKANVDYTLCDQDGCPVVSVEFDGIGDGFNRDGKYLGGEYLSYDAHRPEKLEFKLRLAREAGYPLFIVSYKETKPLEQGETLTILDGIIARALFKRREQELIRAYVAQDEEKIANMSDAEADEHIQDLVLQAGVMAEIETDIFGGDRMRWALEQMGLISRVRSVPYEHPPAATQTMDEQYMFDWKAIRERGEALRRAVWHGTKLSIKVKDGPTIVRNIRVRSVGDWFTAYDLSEKIAMYLATRQGAQFVPPERRAEFVKLAGRD